METAELPVRMDCPARRHPSSGGSAVGFCSDGKAVAARQDVPQPQLQRVSFRHNTIRPARTGYSHGRRNTLDLRGCGDRVVCAQRQSRGKPRPAIADGLATGQLSPRWAGHSKRSAGRPQPSVHVIPNRPCCNVLRCSKADLANGPGHSGSGLFSAILTRHVLRGRAGVTIRD